MTIFDRMRLCCDIEVVERATGSLSLKKGKPIRAQLAVGKSPPSDSVYMMVCTTKNKNGTKYQIKGNIEKVFTKCVSEGKATIRLISPERDICISKADVIQLKSYLNILKQVVQGQMPDKSVFSSLAPVSAKKIERPKTVLVITCKKDYPLTTNFPSSLETLQVHDCSMKKMDSRIFQLRNLVCLDLSDNSLTEVPDGIEKLQNLSDLRLKCNKFEKFPMNICRLKNIQNNLAVLDLSNNQMKELPVQICELANLAMLKMDNNLLEAVPPTIGRLANLKAVSMSNNKLTVLPAGFMRLRLDSVDLFGNNFVRTENVTSRDHVDVPSLVECAARHIRKQRIPYTEDDLHTHLCRYLDSARVCWCGNFCFQCSVAYSHMVNLRTVTSAITAVDLTGSTFVPVQGFLCSPQCLNKFKTDPNAYWR
ncbi:leucine-rich repeat protein 1-like isoform X2 [Dreissena polymorpha]|uniref:leucine-rich repeat protein 1-like isoform X2 n=1 Tax=Dreissena polymorpha TaxID=45954 RepID=UPI002263C09B|nr:leucine-rich repeat protein 1-like isoform X2 [Dreissena polymorpha]XP_052270075.1 leucine-rich repeat protein 1-like isoform X2 [Dreissena polymorpha]